MKSGNRRLSFISGSLVDTLLPILEMLILIALVQSLLLDMRGHAQFASQWIIHCRFRGTVLL